MAGKNKDASLNKRAFTSGFFFILAQLFARGLTFAVTPVYSRLLTKAQYGVVRTYESWLLIAYTIMSLCLWRSVDVAKKDFEDRFIMVMYRAYIHFPTLPLHSSLDCA